MGQRLSERVEIAAVTRPGLGNESLADVDEARIFGSSTGYALTGYHLVSGGS